MRVHPLQRFELALPKHGRMLSTLLPCNLQELGAVARGPPRGSPNFLHVGEETPTPPRGGPPAGARTPARPGAVSVPHARDSANSVASRISSTRGKANIPASPPSASPLSSSAVAADVLVAEEEEPTLATLRPPPRTQEPALSVPGGSAAARLQQRTSAAEAKMQQIRESMDQMRVHKAELRAVEKLPSSENTTPCGRFDHAVAGASPSQAWAATPQQEGNEEGALSLSGKRSEKKVLCVMCYVLCVVFGVLYCSLVTTPS